MILFKSILLSLIYIYKKEIHSFFLYVFIPVFIAIVNNILNIIISIKAISI